MPHRTAQRRNLRQRTVSEPTLAHSTSEEESDPGRQLPAPTPLGRPRTSPASPPSALAERLPMNRQPLTSNAPSSVATTGSALSSWRNSPVAAAVVYVLAASTVLVLYQPWATVAPSSSHMSSSNSPLHLVSTVGADADAANPARGLRARTPPLPLPPAALDSAPWLAAWSDGESTTPSSDTAHPAAPPPSVVRLGPPLPTLTPPADYGDPPASASGPAAHVCSYPMLDFTPPRVLDRVLSAGGARTIVNLGYAPWRVRWPTFLLQEHANWWEQYKVVRWRNDAGCQSSNGWLSFCDPVHVLGAVTLWENVTVMASPVHDCGPSGTTEKLLYGGGDAAAVAVDALFWGVIPAVWTYQHWVQNSLPKLAQAAFAAGALTGGGGAEGAAALLRNPARRLTVNQELAPGRFPIVERLLARAGLGAMDERYRPIRTGLLVDSCTAPPLHPFLWQLGQTEVLRLGAPLPLSARRVVLYCGRSDAKTTENVGRRVLNEDEVLDALRNWGGARGSGASLGLGDYELITFDHRNYPSLDALAALMRRVRVIVGPHGGCLTNVVFMSCGSAAVELFPRLNGEGPPVGHPAMMMYLQSSFVGLHYHMLPVDSYSKVADIAVPLEHLRGIFELALKATASSE